jgi:hypothetical protein
MNTSEVYYPATAICGILDVSGREAHIVNRK